MLLFLALAQDLKLAEIEVAPGLTPKARCVFKEDKEERCYTAELSWRAGNDPGLKRPATAFGEMTWKQARAWALEVLTASFEGDWSGVTNREVSPDTLDGKPWGWSLDLLQSHKGASFYDPDDPGTRAGALVILSDDMTKQEKGASTASFTVRRWTVVKEHGEARAVTSGENVLATVKADFAKAHPGAKVESTLSLFWAPKPGAADRRVPLWHVLLHHPAKGVGKPSLRRYRVDAWTGAVLVAEDVAIPGK